MPDSGMTALYIHAADSSTFNYVNVGSPVMDTVSVIYWYCDTASQSFVTYSNRFDTAVHYSFTDSRMYWAFGYAVMKKYYDYYFTIINAHFPVADEYLDENKKSLKGTSKIVWQSILIAKR